MRELVFVARARVTASTEPGGGRVVLVETWDEWSTRAGLNLSIENELRFEGAFASERNLAGAGTLRHIELAPLRRASRPGRAVPGTTSFPRYSCRRSRRRGAPPGPGSFSTPYSHTRSWERRVESPRVSEPFRGTSRRAYVTDRHQSVLARTAAARGSAIRGDAPSSVGRARVLTTARRRVSPAATARRRYSDRGVR